MPPHLDPKKSFRLLAVVAVGAAVAATVIRIRVGEDRAAVARPMASAVDPLAAKLERCRTILPAQLAANRSCERVWAENRRRFFDARKPALLRSQPIQPNSQRAPSFRDFPAAIGSPASAMNVVPSNNSGTSDHLTKSTLPKTAAPAPKQQPSTRQPDSTAGAGAN